MSRRLTRGVALFVVVLLMGVVGSPAVAAEGPKLEGGWWSAFTARVDQALAAAGLQPLFAESNCAIDPNGSPVCAGAEVDSNCGFDPNGRPASCAGAEVNSRCGFDPNGQPLCVSAEVDSNCSIDPDGSPRPCASM